MKKQPKTFKQKVLAMGIALAALTVLLIVLSILKNDQKVCEFFATTFSRAWIFLFGSLFGWLPFSLYELFLICAIVGCVVFVVFVILHCVKHRWQSLVSLVMAVAIAVLSFVNIYTLSASFAYNRDPLPKEIYTEYTSDEFTYEDAVMLAEYLVERLNDAYQNTQHDENGNIVYPFTFSELSDKLSKEYKRIDGTYLSPYTPHGKQIANKWIMSQLHLTGVFFAPFGEANVNGNETTLYLPLTLAHEMAHSKGVMREYQADMVAAYLLLSCEDPYLCYGALAKYFYTALNLVKKFPNSADKVKEINAKVDNGVLVESRNYSEFYKQFTLLKDVGNFFNDIYLKLQKQPDGTASYTKPGVVESTGEKDNHGNDVVKIVRFSGSENLLIHLVKQQKLPNYS